MSDYSNRFETILDASGGQVFVEGDEENLQLYNALDLNQFSDADNQAVFVADSAFAAVAGLTNDPGADVVGHAGTFLFADTDDNKIFIVIQNRQLWMSVVADMMMSIFNTEALEAIQGAIKSVDDPFRSYDS